MICVFLHVYFPDGKDLYIGKAVQKAYLEVTEEGAEGAVGSGRLNLSFLTIIFLIMNTTLRYSHKAKSTSSSQILPPSVSL